MWRTNLAVDRELPGGIVATLEGIYTKDINAAIHRNYNFITPTQRLTGADNRLIFPGPRNNFETGNPQLSTKFFGPNGTNEAGLNAGVIVLENTKLGYQYSLTGQLRKEFANGFYATAAYTFAQAKDVTSNPGEIAADAFQRLPIVTSNQPQLAYSDFGLQHRIIAAAGRRFAYADQKLATTVSFFFEAAQGNRFSYTYAGDLNRDNISGNDLIFVPANRSQINLVPITNAAGTVLVTADEQYRQLEAYISQDKYLSSRRGDYAERNGSLSPWYTQLDAKILQDFTLTTNSGKKNTLQLSLDILNLGNLLSASWGNRQLAGNNRLIEAGYSSATSSTPTYTFRGGNQTFFTDTSLNSRWRAQVGVRYIFD